MFYYTLKLKNDSIPLQNKVSFNIDVNKSLKDTAKELFLFEMDLEKFKPEQYKQFELFVYDNLESEQPILILDGATIGEN